MSRCVLLFLLKTSPCCYNPGPQSSPDLQQRKTRIGQLNLCRMKLPYRQRQQELASRVRRDHKLALRTTFAALLLVTTKSRAVSATATIQPPEVRKTAITRERLCWNDHPDKSEREGTFVSASYHECGLLFDLLTSDLLAAFLCNVLSVAFMSPEGSKIPKKVFKMYVPRRIILFLAGFPLRSIYLD